MTETPTADYRDRTGRNVRDSDATLIFTRGPLSGGSLLTAGLCRKHRKPCLHVDLAAAPDPLAVSAWLRDHVVRVLNVAGQRESKAPGLQAEVAAFMGRILAAPAPSL